MLYRIKLLLCFKQKDLSPFGDRSSKSFDDPEKRVRYQEFSMEHYNKHVSLFRVSNIEDIDYAVMLVKQVYKKFIEK